MTNYKPEKDLETAAIESKTSSPIILAKWVLNKRNKVISPESVTMYLKRHPELKAAIEAKLSGLSPTAVMAVDKALFENGNFRECASVKNWLMFMNMRRRKGKALKPSYVYEQVTVLKQVCSEYQKHPDRIDFRDAQEIFLAKEQQGKDTYVFRRVLKDFLKSKGVNDWQLIGVGKPRGFGEYKDMFVEHPILEKMLDWVKTQSFQAYTVDNIMYHNGLRVNAVLTAQIEDFKTNGNWKTLTVLEKFRETKTFKIVPKVAELISAVIGERKTGNIFSITLDEIGKLNNQAIELFTPEIRIKYKHIHPNHFWRHMAAQHLLRVTDRNSKAVAALLQCTEQSLNESYGAATSADIEKWENEYLPML